MHSNLTAWCLAVGIMVALTTGCRPSTEAPGPRSGTSILQLVPAHDLPAFKDDLDVPSLKRAIHTSLAYYERLPPEQAVSFGEAQVSVAVLQESLTHFSRILEKHPERLEDSGFLGSEFDVYRAIASESDKLLVTGYYEPVLAGSLHPTARYRYPLYGVPSDLVIVDLAQFDSERFGRERLVGRIVGSRLVPYYTRAEIEGQGKLAELQGQLVWLDDPIAVFFLHIQGSGVVRLEDGQMLRVGYAGCNGRAYRSIGKLLIDKGVITPSEMSLQSIRSYLEQHPAEVDEVLNYNESYVFFRLVTAGPVGNLGQVVTAGRSVATDQHYYPKGGLAFLISEQPRLDANGGLAGWEPLQRWVLNQDTGGAIRGPGRLDLFCGTGQTAESMAGPMKQAGTCYFLLKKGSRLAAGSMAPR